MITSKLNPQVKTCGYALLPLRGISGDLQTTKRTDGILPQNTVAFGLSSNELPSMKRYSFKPLAFARSPDGRLGP